MCLFVVLRSWSIHSVRKPEPTLGLARTDFEMIRVEGEVAGKGFASTEAGNEDDAFMLCAKTWRSLSSSNLQSLESTCGCLWAGRRPNFRR